MIKKTYLLCLVFLSVLVLIGCGGDPNSADPNSVAPTTTPISDATAPETVITSAVDGNGAAVENGGSTLSNSITFTFEGANGAGVSGFQCALDGAVYIPCASPAGYSALAVGSHAFQVRALDTAGNIDPTPANFIWINNNNYIPDGDVAGLIAAINAANANPGADTIDLAPGGTYTLTVADNAGNIKIDAISGLPIINSQIIINGNGATIQRSSVADTPNFRIFYIIGSGDLTLNRLTIRGGASRLGGGIFSYGTLNLINSTVSGNSADYGGGIINNAGTLTITNSTISGNSAVSDGGGIYNNSGTLNLTNSTVSGNSAGNRGGGILIDRSRLTITNSTISGNSATNGGGIYNYYGTLNLTNSTVSGNSAVGGAGGGIYNYFGTLNLTNSTVSGNSADTGGGIHNYGGGRLTITNSTISGNSAGNGGGIMNYNGSTLTITNSTISANSANDGGGIFDNFGTTSLKNTIVANNVANFRNDCSGNVTSLDYNLDSDDSCNLTGENDMSGTDPELGPLADNGGPTLTHALLPDSPAIDAVPLESCTDASGVPVATDQRGVTRPQGGVCDIGSVELN